MQVNLPDALYEQVKSARLDVDAIVQEALAERLAALQRRDALAAALAQHTAESGPFTDAELDRQAETDRRSTVYPRV